MSKKYYAVRHGHQTGIFTDWPTVQQSIHGYSNAKFKGFDTLTEAQAFLIEPPLQHQDLNPNLNQYQVVMYTDGGCRMAHNHRNNTIQKTDQCGWAYQIKNAQFPLENSHADHGYTNNQMELSALIFGLTAIIYRHLQHESILIISDSHYVIDPIQDGRLKQWADHHWHKANQKLVPNTIYWNQVYVLLQQCDHFNFHWTKGHAENLGNNHVDHLLNQAMNNLK